MNYSSIPTIVVLSLMIVMFRPLVRRSGVHVNLWFAGWSFILLAAVNRLLSSPGDDVHERLHSVLGTLCVECAGLAFAMAAGNTQRWLIGPGLIVSMAAGPLIQTLLLLNLRLAALFLPATVALYFVPLAFVTTRPARPSRPLLVTSAAFCIFGLATLSSHTHPYALRAGAMLLIFLCAAYLLVRNSPHVDRAVTLTTVGLLFWGLRYPVLHILRNLVPGFQPNRSLVHLPELLVLGGSVLSMLNERLSSAERLATHDPLTNLPNRRFLYERFAFALDRARSTRTTIACLVIDVDNFKTINDTRGHSAGDELLRALAIRLGWHVGPRDVLARTGGDEFTVMLAGVSNEHYLRFVAEAMMSAVCVPVQIAGEPVDVRISVGIALSPDDADEIEDLIRLADDAMYRAKRRGGNILAFASDAEKPEVVLRRSPAAQILQMENPSRGLTARAAGIER